MSDSRMDDNPHARKYITPQQGSNIADAAMACIGAPFRLHGRDVKTGLDCLGVALFALRAVRPIPALPDNYTLRGPGKKTMQQWARQSGLLPVAAQSSRPNNGMPGDIILVAPAAGQSHLLVMTKTGFVHAHLGCGKTIAVRGNTPWPECARWRLSASGTARP